MKLWTTSLVLAATVQAASWPYVGSKTVEPKYREGAKRVILSYGPITLYGKDEKKPPGSGISMDPKGQSGMGSISQGLCSSCTILSGRFLLRYKDGREASPATGVYIHHVVSYDMSKTPKNPIGGGGAAGLPMAAFVDRGEDSGDTDTIFTSQDGKFNSGFHLRQPKLQIVWDIVNYNVSKQEIFLDVELEYLNGIVGKDAGHTLKTVAGKIALGQNGPAVTKSNVMKVSQDAYIVWARGHLHAGGERMILSVNGKDVCTSLPTYNARNVITTMGLCPEVIPLKKGDGVQIRSVYDLTKHRLRESTSNNGQEAAKTTSGGSDVMAMFAMSYALA